MVRSGEVFCRHFRSFFLASKTSSRIRFGQAPGLSKFATQHPERHHGPEAFSNERIVRHQAARHAHIPPLSLTTNRQPLAAARRASIQRCWARVRPSGITKPGLLITFTQPSICWRRIIVRAARSQARISASVIRLGGTFSSRRSRRPFRAFQPKTCTPPCSVARRGPNVN